MLSWSRLGILNKQVISYQRKEPYILAFVCLLAFFLVLDVGIGVVVTAVIVVVVSVIADIIARRRDRHGRGVRDEYFPD